MPCSICYCLGKCIQTSSKNRIQYQWNIKNQRTNQAGTNKYLPKYIELNSGGFMRLRGSPTILRIHSSNKKKGDEGIYSELLLFFHWRDEKLLRKNRSETFNINYSTIEKTKKSIYPNSAMIDIIRELVEKPEESKPLHLIDIDAAGEQENFDNEVILESLDTSKLPDEEPELSNIKSDGFLFKPVVVDEDEVMLNYARSLLFGQIIMFIR